MGTTDNTCDTEEDYFPKDTPAYLGTVKGYRCWVVHPRWPHRLLPREAAIINFNSIYSFKYRALISNSQSGENIPVFDPLMSMSCSIRNLIAWPSNRPATALSFYFGLWALEFKDDLIKGEAFQGAYSVSPIGTKEGLIVLGEVAGWGEIKRYRRGWQASRAYPISLVDPCTIPDWNGRQDIEWVTSIADRYGIPVVNWKEI